MAVRVELTEHAAADLARYQDSDIYRRLLAKLIYLEENGEDAGHPLGGALTGLRKIVVGDRNWRILYSLNADKTVATVHAIGDRADDEVYEEAARRVETLTTQSEEARSLAAMMFQLSESKRKRKRRK